MILQWYTFAVESAEGPVYDGTAEFGFFPPRECAIRWASETPSFTA